MDIQPILAFLLLTVLPAWIAFEKRIQWLYARREKIAAAVDQAWHAAYVLLPQGSPLQAHVATAHDRLVAILRGSGIELADAELGAVDAQLQALHGKLLFEQRSADPNVTALQTPPSPALPTDRRQFLRELMTAPDAAAATAVSPPPAPAPVAPPAPPPPPPKPEPVLDPVRNVWTLPTAALLVLCMVLSGCVAIWPKGCVQTSAKIACTGTSGQFLVSPHPTLPRPAARVELIIDGQALPLTVDFDSLTLPPAPTKP